MSGAVSRRFRRSQAYLRMWALPLDATDTMAALDEASALVSVRNADEIVARLFAWTLLGLKGQGLTQAEAFAFADVYDVWPVLTVEESALLLDPAPSRIDLVQAAWRFEGAWVMLWALGQVRHLAFPDRVVDSGAVVELCMTAIASRSRGERPPRRPVGEILDAADITRRVAVVAASAQMHGQPPPSALVYGVVHERAEAFAWLVGDV